MDSDFKLLRDFEYRRMDRATNICDCRVAISKSKITEDRAAKPVEILSAIGGTMGLLTGFSLISGVEIIYFSVKLIVDFVKRRYSSWLTIKQEIQ